jgi:hypothetical protein
VGEGPCTSTGSGCARQRVDRGGRIRAGLTAAAVGVDLDGVRGYPRSGHR